MIVSRCWKTYHFYNEWCILKRSFELKPPSFWHWFDMVNSHNGLIFAKNKTKNKNTIIENAHFQFEINAFIQNGNGLLGNRYRCSRNCHPRPKQITASYRLKSLRISFVKFTTRVFVLKLVYLFTFQTEIAMTTSHSILSSPIN